MLSVRGLECRLAGRQCCSRSIWISRRARCWPYLDRMAPANPACCVLAGELHWSAGTVAYADQPLRQLRSRQLAALRAVLPQQLPQLAGLERGTGGRARLRRACARSAVTKPRWCRRR